MEDPAASDLYRRAAALLEPGDITLHGAVVHTDVSGENEPELHQVTIEIGECLADRLDAPDTYVYSGTDDPEFGLNQHQGRTLADDAFVWECQQLLRGDTFDVVFYWEATDDHKAILSAIRDLGHEVIGVTADGVIE